MKSNVFDAFMNAFWRAYESIKDRIGLYWSYYDGSHSETVTGGTGDAKFLILSRSCYSEEVWEFPPCDDRELKKMLKLRLALDRDVRYELVPRVDESFQGARYVIVWRPSISLPPRAFMWLPVSWLVASSSPNVTLVFEKNDSTRLMAQRHARGIASIEVDKSVMSVDQFRLGIGVESSSEVLTRDSVRRGAFDALARLKLLQFAPFFPSLSAIFSFERVLQWVVSIALAWILFMALSSAILVTREKWIANQLDTFRADTGEILSMRERGETDNELVLATLSTLEMSNHHADLWQVYRSVLDIARIQTVRLEGGSVVLEGEASSSVSVMERLLDSKNVHKARFNRPVRRVGGYEEFSISIQLRGRGEIES